MKKIFSIIIFFSFLATLLFCESSEEGLLQKIKENPSNYIYYKELGIYYFKNNDFFKAIENLSTALNLQEVDKDIYVYLFKAYLIINKYKDAEFVLVNGIKYFPELKKYYDEGITYTFNLWVESYYYHNKYKEKIHLLKEIELKSDKLFNYQKFLQNYEDFEKVKKFNELLENFYFYKDLELAEIIGNKILTDLIITYKITALNTDIIDEIRKYLIEKTEVISVKYEKYYGYKKLQKLRENDTENTYKKFFSPIIIEVRAPFLNKLLNEHITDQIIEETKASKMKFDEEIKKIREVYEKIKVEEYRAKLENFIFSYVSEKFKNLREHYKVDYSNLFLSLFPEEKFKIFFNLLKEEEKRIYGKFPEIESISEFISNENNFVYLDFSKLNLESDLFNSLIKTNPIFLTDFSNLNFIYNIKNEEYSLSEIIIKDGKRQLIFNSSELPIKFYRSISRYYKEKNEIVDWTIKAVINVKDVKTIGEINKIRIDIFYLKLYNKKTNLTIYEKFNIKEFDKTRYNLDKSKILNYIYYLE
ncbi:MAG TPA: hypothetical protein PLD27_10835 [bacterium]|nr:hypothetical protein [bacterium]HOL48117.1 hypothetical protein [bacterium]HPQ19722.1 hypothetical protein [bacterium]